MLNYRSYIDLAACIKKHTQKLSGYDLYVGIPRSGLLAANMMALLLNKPVCTVQELVNNLNPQNGFSREVNNKRNYDKILVVDDTVNTGKSINYVKELLNNNEIDASYCAVYATEASREFVDMALEILERPRIFQWNYLNNSILKHSAVCFEDVICSKIKNPRVASDVEVFLNATSPNLLENPQLKLIFTGYNRNVSNVIESWLASHNICADEIIYSDGKKMLNKLDNAFFESHKDEFCNAKLVVLGSNCSAKQITSLLNVPCMAFNDKLYQ